MFTMKKTLMLVVIFLASIFLGKTSLVYSEVRGVTHDTIKIGVIGDLTGPVAQVATPYTRGFINYFRYINEQGGIHDRKLKVTVENDRYSIPMAISAFKKLVYRDNVFALFAISQTGAFRALMDRIEKERIVLFTYSGAEFLVSPLKRHIFVSVPSYEDHVRADIDYIMNDLKAKDPRVAFVAPDTEAGKVGFLGFKDQAKLYNLKTHKEVVNFRILDAASQILNLKRFKADYVVTTACGIALTSLFLRDAQKYGFFPSGFFGDYASCEEDVLAMSKKAAKHYYASHSCNSWFSNTSEIGKLREITMKYGPDTKSKSKSYILAWLKSTLFVEGLKRTGKDLTTKRLVNSLEGIKDFSTGLTGLVTFSPEDHRGVYHMRIFKADIEKGIMVSVTDWRKAVSK